MLSEWDLYQTGTALGLGSFPSLREPERLGHLSSNWEQSSQSYKHRHSKARFIIQAPWVPWQGNNGPSDAWRQTPCSSFQDRSFGVTHGTSPRSSPTLSCLGGWTGICPVRPKKETRTCNLRPVLAWCKPSSRPACRSQSSWTNV